ncbi:hypothetical protein KC19_2G130700 [Ceratodon purpureus]|uniref:Secreted protein n=1 Tax=Ceratodon purpureus TaxID=3225 RepID=A0A8T0ITA6_CERPU|nr:hypothetical protein KC19_2G130700 [Ceratodon purpureus]
MGSVARISILLAGFWSGPADIVRYSDVDCTFQMFLSKFCAHMAWDTAWSAIFQRRPSCSQGYTDWQHHSTINPETLQGAS